MAKYAKFFSVGGGAGPNGLQLPLGTVLDATLRQVQDGIGTGSPLYLSTGSVRIGTTVASAMYWDNTNNRLGVGTNTPTEIGHFYNTALADIYLKVQTTQSRTSGWVSQNSTANWFAGTQYSATNAYQVFDQTNNRLQMTLFNDGNSQFANTNTSIGAKLGIKGSGSTSATTSLLVQNSGGNTALQVTDDRTTTTSGTLTNITTTAALVNGLGLTASSMGGYTGVGIYRSGGGEGQIDITHYNAYTSNGVTIREFFGTGQNLFNSATKFELRILGGFTTGNMNNLVGNTLWIEPIYNITANTGTIVRGIYYNPTLTSLTGTTHYGIQTTSGGAYINTTTPQASACLQADSTTQGFLPPRVTTAQKNAISLPANGLMVYDTDLARPCFFNGATWTTL